MDKFWIGNISFRIQGRRQLKNIKAGVHKKCKLAMSDTRTALHSSLCETLGGDVPPLAPPVPEALSSVKVMNGSSKKVQNIQMLAIVWREKVGYFCTFYAYF